MMYFAQFILWLQPYFSSIRECDVRQVRKFCWRLDHIRYDHPDASSNNLLWVREWVRGVCAEISEWVLSLITVFSYSADPSIQALCTW